MKSNNSSNNVTQESLFDEPTVYREGNRSSTNRVSESRRASNMFHDVMSNLGLEEVFSLTGRDSDTSYRVIKQFEGKTHVGKKHSFLRGGLSTIIKQDIYLWLVDHIDEAGESSEFCELYGLLVLRLNLANENECFKAISAEFKKIVKPYSNGSGKLAMQEFRRNYMRQTRAEEMVNKSLKKGISLTVEEALASMRFKVGFSSDDEANILDVELSQLSDSEFDELDETYLSDMPDDPLSADHWSKDHDTTESSDPEYLIHILDENEDNYFTN